MPAGARVHAAYGLALEGDVEVAGAGPVPPDSVRGRVAVTRTDGPRADDGAREELFVQRGAGGDVAVRLDRDEDGFAMEIAGFAGFDIAADGTAVACRPQVEPDWRWQRVLAGHALPTAAILQGVEVLHAGAVALEVGGRRVGIAIAAVSQGGKSSLSVNLTLAGARLLTDDALAVEPAGDGTVLAHPGVGAASVRDSELARLRAAGLDAQLEIVGEFAGAARVLVERQDAPVPLAAIYWPERRPDVRAAEFTRLPPDPVPVLAATANLVLRDAARMRRHLEVSAAIAEAVPLFRVGVPRGMHAGELAAAIEDHAAG